MSRPISRGADTGYPASKEETAKALSALYRGGQRNTDHYEGIFQKARVALWDEDFSPVLDMLDRLRARGVRDLREYFTERRERLIEAIDLVRLNDVNEYTVKLFEADHKADLLASLASVFVPESEAIFLEELVTLWEGGHLFESEMTLRTLKGHRLEVLFSVAYEGARCESTLVSIVDITARKKAEADAQRLASIVESSEDAIYSNDLNGHISSWNRGAARLFGYARHEVLGRHVFMLIPPGRWDEEFRIQERIKRGESIEHYETQRRRKDGSAFDVSLAVSPVRRADGTLIGAAKIARDITERKRAQEQQRLLMKEMKHRIKNNLAIVQSLARQTFTDASAEQRESFEARLLALANAHDLLTREQWDRGSLHDVVTGALEPFLATHRDRFVIEGCPLHVEANDALILTMAFHELATNATKYGALSNGKGNIRIAWTADECEKGTIIKLSWQEHGGPPVSAPKHRGFGSRLVEHALRRPDVGGGHFEFAPDGLICTLAFPAIRN